MESTWQSIKEHQDEKWFKDYVFSMRPSRAVQAPVAVEAGQAEPANVQWISKSNLEGAKDVYHRYYSANALEENCWTGPDDESVLRTYYRMNIHYYMGKGHTPHKHPRHTHSVIMFCPSSSHDSTTSQLCLFADKDIYDLVDKTNSLHQSAFSLTPVLSA